MTEIVRVERRETMSERGREGRRERKIGVTI